MISKGWLFLAVTLICLTTGLDGKIKCHGNDNADTRCLQYFETKCGSYSPKCSFEFIKCLESKNVTVWPILKKCSKKYGIDIDLDSEKDIYGKTCIVKLESPKAVKKIKKMICCSCDAGIGPKKFTEEQVEIIIDECKVVIETKGCTSEAPTKPPKKPPTKAPTKPPTTPPIKPSTKQQIP